MAQYVATKLHTSLASAITIPLPKPQTSHTVFLYFYTPSGGAKSVPKHVRMTFGMENNLDSLKLEI